MSEEYKGYTISIKQDELDESPREWDNLGTMCCDHRRVVLPWEFEYLDQKAPVVVYQGNERLCRSWEDVKVAINQRVRRAGDEIAVILPVYAYDHSCFDLSTKVEQYWWHAAWDSGQVGFIFITKSKVRQEYGWKKLTASRLSQVADYLRAEVQTYSQYVNGDVWYYSIDDPEGEQADSCGSFYGYNEAEKAAKEAVDYLVEKGG